MKNILNETYKNKHKRIDLKIYPVFTSGTYKSASTYVRITLAKMFSLNLDRCQTTENLQHSLFSKRFINMFHRKLLRFQISWTLSMVLDNWSSFPFRGCSFLTVLLSMPVGKNVLTVFFSHAHFCVSALVFAFPNSQLDALFMHATDHDYHGSACWLLRMLETGADCGTRQNPASSLCWNNSIVSLQTVAAAIDELICLG